MRTAIVLLAVLALTGCSATEPAPTLSSADAIERYQPVFDEVSAAVEKAYPGHEYTLDNEHDLVDTSPCIIWIGDLENRTTDADDRYDYIALIAPFIEDAGFDDFRELDPVEGAPSMPTFIAEDDLGTQASVTFDYPGFSFAIVANVVDDPCEP